MLCKMGYVFYCFDCLYLGFVFYVMVVVYIEVGVYVVYGKIDLNGQFYFGLFVEFVVDLEDDDDQIVLEIMV